MNIEKTFGTDEKWVQAKAIARQEGQENNWVEIMSYYHELGGQNVELFCRLEEGDVRRLVVPLDGGECVYMLRNKRQAERASLVPYEEALTSIKEFVFNLEPEIESVELPDGHTFLGDSTIDISIT